jgi:dipeptidyl aminopeptidase/acylaminoacyl peptidase
MPAKKKNITVDDLWKVERIGAVSLSPDGTQAACTVTRYSMDDNKSAASLWLLSTTGGEPRRLTACGEKDGQPHWSPRGDFIGFVARREQEGTKDDAPQLYVIAADGGEARRVSDYANGIDAYKWFPDGKRIAFISWVWPEERGAKAQAKRHKAFKERKESAYVTSEAQYRHWDHHLPMGRVPHLLVLDLGSGRVTDLFEGSGYELPRAEPDATTFDIAPDGHSIVFVHDPADEKRLDHCKALAEVRLKDGRISTLAADADWDFNAPRFSPDGKHLAFTASHQAKRHTMPAQLALLARSGRKARWEVLSAHWDHEVNAPLRWASDGRSILFTAEDRARCHLHRFDLASREVSVQARGGWVQGFDVAGDTVLSAADAMDHPVRVHAHRNGSARRIERFNDELLAGLALAGHDEIVYKGAQGEGVHMWLVYPPGFDAKKRYPLLHSIHGGPHSASGDTWHYRWNNQVFAAQGYVVACVNYHGSSGFGYDFLDSNTGRWGELELKDVEAATDLLLKKPFVDARRVYASGGSYGGYMVAWMNAHVPDGRYKAYVCHAGCFDWAAMFADDAYHWHAKDLGAFYWDDMARVHAQSPHARASTMHTPTLVIHGAQDYRVPDQQGLAYYNTLKARGVDARLVWFPDENHWILKPRNSKLWYGEFFGWLERHAKRKA